MSVGGSNNTIINHKEPATIMENLISRKKLVYF